MRFLVNRAKKRVTKEMKAVEAKEVVSLANLEQAKVYVAVPEYLHKEIAGLLLSRGFTDYILVDAEMEYSLMKSFYVSVRGQRYHNFHLESPQRHLA